MSLWPIKWEILKHRECFICVSISSSGTCSLSYCHIFALVHITEGFILRCKQSIRMWLDTQALCVQQMEPFSRESHLHFVKDFPKCQQMVSWEFVVITGITASHTPIMLPFCTFVIFISFFFSVNCLKQDSSDFSWNWDMKTRKPYYYY